MAAPLQLSLASLKGENESRSIQQKVFTILNYHLQNNKYTSATEAATDLDELTPMKREARGEDAEHLESFLWKTWGTFIEIAKQIPHDHPSQAKMVQIIKALTTLPAVEIEIWTALDFQP